MRGGLNTRHAAWLQSISWTLKTPSHVLSAVKERSNTIKWHNRFQMVQNYKETSGSSLHETIMAFLAWLQIGHLRQYYSMHSYPSKIYMSQTAVVSRVACIRALASESHTYLVSTKLPRRPKQLFILALSIFSIDYLIECKHKACYVDSRELFS